MFVDTTAHPAVPRDAVYAKTAKGRGEVTLRGMGLSRRQRSVLILLDGQRSCAALAALMPEGQVDGIVTALLALDLIAPCAGPAGAMAAAAATSTPAVPHKAAAQASAFAVPPADAPADDGVTAPPADVPDAGPAPAGEGAAAIRAYMVHAAQTCLGLLAAEVVGRVERAHDAAQLRGVVGHWHMALQASKHGRETAAAHLERVRAGLRDAGIDA